MNDEILKDLLSDILQQQAAIEKNVSETKLKTDKLIELYQKSIDEKSTSNMLISEFQAKNFLETFDLSLNQLKLLSHKIPKEVKVTKIEQSHFVLFSKLYSEGQYGLKDLLKGLYLFVGGCFFVFLLFAYIPRYLGRDYQNLAYKETLEWYYIHSDAKNKKALIKTLNHFKNQDTLYINELTRFKENNKTVKYE